MTRARLVLRVIDAAFQALEHHPRLFSEYVYHDRSAVQLARRFEAHKRARPQVVGGRRDLDEVERVDSEWEDRHAERRRIRYEKRAADFGSERRAKRAMMTELEMLREVYERAGRMSTVAASNPEPSRGGGEGIGPPRQQRLTDDPRWREHEAVIRRRLGYMLDLLDEAQGFGAVANPTLSAEEKDAKIVHHSMEGKTALQVYDELGPYVAGSPETVRRVRRKAGLDRVGVPRADESVSGSV